MSRSGGDPTNRIDLLLRPLLPQYSHKPAADNTHTNADEVMEHADNWQFSKNSIYCNLQKALAQRAPERKSACTGEHVVWPSPSPTRFTTLEGTGI